MADTRPTNADPRTAIDAGGLLAPWRARRRCRVCRGRIVRGPFVVCQDNSHAYELTADDLANPITPRERHVIERDYVLRWLLGAVAFGLALLWLVGLRLNSTGLLADSVVVGIGVVTAVLGFAAFLLSPPLIALPSRERFQREARAAEQPTEW